MEELIDIIIRNPLLILLIIGGLLSFFQDKSSSKKKQQQPAQTVDTKDKVEHTAPQQVEQSQETVKDYLEQIELQEAAEEVGAEANLERLEEHRQKQIERLQKAHYPEVQ